MKRKVLATAAALALAATMLPVLSASVLADSKGGCSDSETHHYSEGNWQPTVANIERIKAVLTIPGSAYFGPCGTPASGNLNASIVGIVLIRSTYLQQPWVMAGIVRCLGDAPYCTGSPRLFSEWHEGFTGNTVVRDLGAASYSTNYTFMIDLDGPAEVAQVYVNDSLKTTWDVGSQLNPGDDPEAMWKAETWDAGDGLGNNVSGQSTNIGTMQYRKDGVWWYRSAQCNLPNPSSQIECRDNGTNGQYFYTVN